MRSRRRNRRSVPRLLTGFLPVRRNPMHLRVSQTDWATVCHVVSWQRRSQASRMSSAYSRQSRDDSGDIDRLALNHGAVLERVGVPIYQERQGRRARWRVMEGYRRSLSITLSWPEMMALVLGRKLLEKLSAPLADAATTATAKLNDALLREIAQRAAGFDN